MFHQLCGDAVLGNVTIVTNMWTRDSHDINEVREKELSGNFFKPVLDKGARIARHDDTVQSAHDIIRGIMKKNPLVLRIQRELVDQHKDIADTAAGKIVNGELDEQTGRHQAELREVREGMAQALKKKDDEMKQGLEQARRLQEQMDKIKRDSKGMEARVMELEQEAKERQRAEAQLANLSRRLQDATNGSAGDRARLEQELKKEREQVEAEYRRQLADLTRRLRDVTNTSAADRARLEREAVEERRQAEAQLVNLNRRLQDATNASATDRARWEQEVKKERERVETEYKRQLADLTRRLQDVTNASAVDRARLEREAKEERQRAEVELANLNRRLQDATSAFAADRARLEQEIKRLQNHAATPPPCPIP